MSELEPGLAAFIESNILHRSIYGGMSDEQQKFVRLIWHAGARDALTESMQQLRESLIR